MNVEAKKTGDGQWEFRPFHRSWQARLQAWRIVDCDGVGGTCLDPQFSFKKISVTFSSPSLPSWLSWKGSELSAHP